MGFLVVLDSQNLFSNRSIFSPYYTWWTTSLSSFRINYWIYINSFFLPPSLFKPQTWTSKGYHGLARDWRQWEFPVVMQETGSGGAVGVHLAWNPSSPMAFDLDRRIESRRLRRLVPTRPSLARRRPELMGREGEPSPRPTEMSAVLVCRWFASSFSTGCAARHHPPPEQS
jgi:hypothetical protein